MTPKDLELLRGMCNCYATCREDFDGTVKMVASARGLEPEFVRGALKRMSVEYSNDPRFQELRNILPSEFPF
jgi:hypothetical protein